MLLQLRAPGAEPGAEAQPRENKLDAACASAEDGQACVVENRRGKKVHGVCLPKSGSASALSCSPKKQAVPEGPPAEALAACEGKNLTDRCVFATGDDGNVTGKCFSTPAGMLCRRQHGAPDAARAACVEKPRDAECGWTNRAGKEIAGRCKPRGDVDVCVPSPPRESVEACSQAEVEQACAFQFKSTTVNGTCRSHDGEVVCSPLQRAVWSPVGPAGAAETPPDPKPERSAGKEVAEEKPLRKRKPREQSAKEAACVNANVDDACSFTGRNGDVTGTCQAGVGKHRDRLVCATPRGVPENTTGTAESSDDDDEAGGEEDDTAAGGAAVNVSVAAGGGEDTAA